MPFVCCSCECVNARVTDIVWPAFAFFGILAAYCSAFLYFIIKSYAFNGYSR